MSMEAPIIIKGVGSFYEVLDGDTTITCKAKGSFRKEGITPLVGDRVQYATFEKGYARIEEILPRKNALIRPAAANIDRLFIVLSAGAPAPDYLLCDKLLVEAGLSHIEPILLLNKMDAARGEVQEIFDRDYASFPHFFVSAHTGEGLEQIQALISGHVCCFAGQSAVGKSSLINGLLPQLELPTGDLAKKTERGRHTTRHAQLYPCFGGALLDTPGFSLFEPESYDMEALNSCYPEFVQAEPCRFPGCAHMKEPGCGVKALLKEGKLSQERYDRYVLIAQDFIYRRKHRYD